MKLSMAVSWLLTVALTLAANFGLAGEWALKARAASDVVIARAGSLVSDTVATDHQGTPVRLIKQTVQIELVIKGQLQSGSSVTVIIEDHDSPTPTSTHLLRAGKLHVLVLARGDVAGLVTRNLVTDNTLTIPASERLVRLDVEVADKTYLLEGADEIQKLASIFSQSYAMDGKNLMGIELAAPTFTTSSGSYEQYSGDGDQSSPGFLSFYNSTIEPRLLAAAGSDLRKRANIFATSLGVGVSARRPDFRAAVLELDATWPNVNEDIGVSVADPDVAWLTARLSSRLKCFRVNAIQALPHVLAHRNAIIVLTNDPQEDVRVEALRWLQRLRSPGAPQIVWNTELTGPKILNEQELKAYWNAMIPPPS